MSNELHKYFPGVPGNSRERIQDLLREKNMSQAELAETLGLSESALSRYLSRHTDKLSTDNIVAIARVFNVTTDFLLCLTDIPFTTNYDIEKLGLTVSAAKNLLERKVNPNIISTLLEMQEFIVLTQKLDQIRTGTMAAGIASMKAVFKQTQDLFLKRHRIPAKIVLRFVKPLKISNHSNLFPYMKRIPAESRFHLCDGRKEKKTGSAFFRTAYDAQALALSQL